MFNSFLRVCVSMLNVELQSGSLPSKRDRRGKPKESRRSDPPPIAQVIQSEVAFFMDRALGCLREGLCLFVCLPVCFCSLHELVRAFLQPGTDGNPLLLCESVAICNLCHPEIDFFNAFWLAIDAVYVSAVWRAASAKSCSTSANTFARQVA